MENENKKREELTEELNVENVETVEEPLAEEPEMPEVLEETEAASEEAEEIVEETAEVTEEIIEETAEETEEPEEKIAMLSEEEVAEINAELDARKKKTVKFYSIIIAAIVAVAAIIAFFICYTEGTFGNTAVNKPVSSLTQETPEADNIKYQNPIAEIFGGKNTVMKIDGQSVDKNVFHFFANSTGINCVYSMLQMGMISDVSNFDWNALDKTSGLSYNELSKAMALDSLVPVYALISEGEKRGIVFTEEDENKIYEWIGLQRSNYGEEFENILKKSGYADENTLFEVQKMQVYTQKVYDDIAANPDSYITDDVKKSLGDDKITVKHVLIQAETEEEKENAKKEAEMVLEKAKNGEEFEKLIAEYNDDPGMANDPTGYTFAKDGTMVPEFEEASFKLEVGEISGLVETSFGYHIIKRVERAVTPEDYIDSIGKKASVRIKKGVYDNMKVNINLDDYFGAPATEEPKEETSEAN